MAQLLVASVSRTLQPLAVALCVATVVNRMPQVAAFADERAPATMSVEQIRRAVAQAHERIRSLRVEYRAFKRGDGPSGGYLRVVVAAKDRSRYESLGHVVPGQTEDPGAYVNLYDGACFDTYYVFGHRYETTRLAATPRYTFKVRAHAFFECLAWWPPGDDSQPPRLKKRGLFLKEVLADTECRVRPYQECIDGRSCHVVEIPGIDVVWIDAERGALLKRERFSGGDRPELIARYYLGSYRDVRGGIWLPYTIHRVLEATSLDTLYEVQKYEVNSVPDELFSFTPVPGTLIVDRDTDTFRQVPGGTDYLQELCARANSISGGAARGTTSVGALALRLLTIAACGAVLAFMGGAILRVRRRSRQ